MIILDTDVLIEIFDRDSERGEASLEAIIGSGEDIATTSINLHEILYGLEKYAKPVKDVLLLPALPYDKRDAQTSAMIELRSEADGRAARRTDAMIAAIAINRGALLFTFSVRHFKGLEEVGLKMFPTTER
ncbi:type II toxin-antitoxin system VapC family toxin [Candidatus Bathyarchaeota archaeon]|nr:type II toxin-antitoxin system VapC family toxin [Candidatus Bathyarchaeota archaeon]MBL7168033.1 type II toxin-antitoxin system VapC family toxin [Candidatus Bathyarchaeota archaeon]